MAFLAPALAAAAPAAAGTAALGTAAAAAPAIGAAAAPALGAGIGAAAAPAMSSLIPGTAYLHTAQGLMPAFGTAGGLSPIGSAMGGAAAPGFGAKLLESMPDMANAMKGNQPAEQQFAPAGPGPSPMQQNMSMQSPSLMESLNQQTRDDQMGNPGMDLATLMERFNHRA